MNIGGLGGAASLPMLVSLSLPGQPAAPAVTAGPATSGSSADQHLPGSRAADSKTELKTELKAEAAEAKARFKEEVAKPPPLPPLKVLTVAEFRVMLGIPQLPMQTGGAGGSPGTRAATPSAAYGSYA
jgi:hypothetical protein